MKKRILSMLVILSLVLGICNVAMAEETTDINISGVSMSANDFKNTFGVARSSRSVLSIASSNIFAPSELALSNIVINGESVSLNINLSNGEQLVTLPIVGELGASYKAQRGVNSTIIDVAEVVNGYEVLLFEIFNDTENNNLLVNSTLEGSPHVKVYLKDSNNNIYLFEAQMPAAFACLNAANYDEADKEHDAFWAYDLVERETIEVPVDDTMLSTMGLGVQTRAVGEWIMWTSPTIYIERFTIGIDEVECHSMPYITYYYSNVSSTGEWIASFKVSEHMSVGSAVYHGNNSFDYRNVDISFGSGDKTTLLRWAIEGRMMKYNHSTILEDGATATVTLLKTVVDIIPWGSTATSVLSAINSMVSESSEKVLGSSSQSISNRFVAAAGVYIGEYIFEECTDYNGYTNIGHYLTFNVTPGYATGNGSNDTVGVLKVEFDTYQGNSSYAHVSKQFDFNYSSTP